MNVQLTNLQRLCDALMSTWTRILKECFWNMRSMPQRTEVVWKVKEEPPMIITAFLIIFLDECIFCSSSLQSRTH